MGMLAIAVTLKNLKKKEKKKALSYNIYNIYKAAYVYKSPSWKEERSHTYSLRVRGKLCLLVSATSCLTFSRNKCQKEEPYGWWCIYMFRLAPALLWVKWDMPIMHARSGPHLLPCPKPFGMLPTLGFYPTH